MDITAELLREIDLCDTQLERLRLLNDPISRALRDEIAGRRATLERLIPVAAGTPVTPEARTA